MRGEHIVSPEATDDLGLLGQLPESFGTELEAHTFFYHFLLFSTAANFQTRRSRKNGRVTVLCLRSLLNRRCSPVRNARTLADRGNGRLRLTAPGELIMGCSADMAHDSGPEAGQAGSVRVPYTRVNHSKRLSIK